MKMDIQARGFTLTDALRHAVEHEAHDFEHEFPERLHSVSVRLFDVNGVRGGIDKGCLVFARFGRHRATVVASDIDANLYRAISTSFERLSRGTRQSMNRDRRLRRSRRVAAGDAARDSMSA